MTWGPNRLDELGSGELQELMDAVRDALVDARKREAKGWRSPAMRRREREAELRRGLFAPYDPTQALRVPGHWSLY